MTQPFIKNGKPVFSGGQPSFGCGDPCQSVEAAFSIEWGPIECLAYEEIGDSPITDIDGDGNIEPNNPTGGKRCVEWEQTLYFTDESQASDGAEIVSWLWDFGDGSTSTEQNPTHTFTPGTGPTGVNTTDPVYDDGSNETSDELHPILRVSVTLTIVDSEGCESTKDYSGDASGEESGDDGGDDGGEEVTCDQMRRRIKSMTATISGMREDCVANTYYSHREWMQELVGGEPCSITSCEYELVKPEATEHRTDFRDSGYSCADFNGSYEVTDLESAPWSTFTYGKVEFEIDTCYNGLTAKTQFAVDISTAAGWHLGEYRGLHTRDDGMCYIPVTVRITEAYVIMWHPAMWQGWLKVDPDADAKIASAVLTAVNLVGGPGTSDHVTYRFGQCYGWPLDGTCDDVPRGGISHRPPPSKIPNCAVEVRFT
tara:strand:+ start:33314 stop:34594 length:1281 start_codon:yes stop_codon:yes gene_type:complete